MDVKPRPQRDDAAERETAAAVTVRHPRVGCVALRFAGLLRFAAFLCAAHSYTLAAVGRARHLAGADGAEKRARRCVGLGGEFKLLSIAQRAAQPQVEIS